MDKPLTINEAAERLAVNRFHVYRLIKAGELAAVNVGHRGARRRTLRIFPESLEAFVRSREVEAREHAEGQQPSAPARQRRLRRERLVAAGLV